MTGAIPGRVSLSVWNDDGQRVDLSLAPARARAWAKELEAHADAIAPIGAIEMSKVETEEVARGLCAELAAIVAGSVTADVRRSLVQPAIIASIFPGAPYRKIEDKLMIAIAALGGLAYSMIDDVDGRSTSSPREGDTPG